MKSLLPVSIVLLPTVRAFSAIVAAQFDGGADTPYTLENFSDPAVAGGGASIQTTGGNPGGFLQLTPNVNGQNNWAMFNKTDVGAVPVSTFSFQFRFDNLGAGGAVGISFNYFPT